MGGNDVIWGIVPVKTLSQAKSRLAPVLPPAERLDLSLQMLDRVLTALQQARLIGHWLVVSRDIVPLELARRRNGLALREEGEGLNSSLRQAALWVADRGAEAVLVVPSDLPLINGQEIDALISYAGSERDVVIVPSRRGDGTNGLFLRPPDALPFCFGPQSAERHAGEARERGLEAWIYNSERLGFDVDTAEDLKDLAALRA